MAWIESVYPIVAPSILTLSTVANVADIVPGVVAPIVTPSIVPPLISAVVNTLLSILITPVVSAIVAHDAPSLDFILVTFILVVSTVVELTAVILPVVDPKVVIVIAAIVPPSTLSPLIWLSANSKVPSDTFNVLPVPTVISLVAILVPSIVPPLISAFVNVLFVRVWVASNWTISLLLIVAIWVAVSALPLTSPVNEETLTHELPL